MAEHPEMSVEERVILFVDVHHFSTAFDDLLEGCEFLLEMYENLGERIVAHGGELIKYMGDSFLAVFPAGGEAEAVAAALEMRAIFKEMVHASGINPQIELEVGIGAGPVVIGVCGHRSLRLKDVFGHTVHQTALIGHYQGVAITEGVYEQVKDSYQTVRLPDFETRQPGEAFQVWAVLE